MGYRLNGENFEWLLKSVRENIGKIKPSFFHENAFIPRLSKINAEGVLD